MKKTKIILTSILALMLVGTMVGCGGSKTSGVSAKGRKAVAMSEAQIYAEQKPTLRAWGTFNSPYERQASRGAAAYARAEGASNLKARIKAVFSDNPNLYNKIASSATETKAMTDGDNVTKDGIDQITDEILKGYAVVKTNMFQEENGTYTAYVCVEYSGDLAKLAQETANRVKQQISDDERLKMDFNYMKFKEDMEKEMKAYEEKLKNE